MKTLITENGIMKTKTINYRRELQKYWYQNKREIIGGVLEMVVGFLLLAMVYQSVTFYLLNIGGK